MPHAARTMQISQMQHCIKGSLEWPVLTAEHVFELSQKTCTDQPDHAAAQSLIATTRLRSPKWAIGWRASRTSAGNLEPAPGSPEKGKNLYQ